MKPVVDGLETQYGDRIEFKVYAEADKDAAASEFAEDKDVRYVPTMMLVSPEGREMNRWVGEQAEPSLSAAFDAALQQ